MKKIKLSHGSPAMRLEKQTPGCTAQWGNCQFFINQEIPDCDVWVVFGGMQKDIETTNCPSGQTIFVTGEPSSIWLYDKKFLKQFGHIITCQREIKGPGVKYYLQGHPWHIGLNHACPTDLGLAKNYDELSAMSDVPKTKLLSIITSNKQSTLGHRQRYEFALRLKEALGDQADLFGRGIQDFNDKWEVLAPYKYSIAIENSAHTDYISEKLFDCYLAHNFPFYYGAPNVDDYFPAASYERLNIDDLVGTIAKIKKIINDSSHYETHLPALLAAKQLYLNKYNIFPLIADIVSAWPDNQPRQTVVLKTSGLSLRNRLKILVDKIMTLGA